MRSHKTFYFNRCNKIHSKNVRQYNLFIGYKKTNLNEIPQYYISITFRSTNNISVRAAYTTVNTIFCVCVTTVSNVKYNNGMKLLLLLSIYYLVFM